jgi:hypothetical protein
MIGTWDGEWRAGVYVRITGRIKSPVRFEHVIRCTCLRVTMSSYGTDTWINGMWKIYGVLSDPSTEIQRITTDVSKRCSTFRLHRHGNLFQIVCKYLIEAVETVTQSEGFTCSCRAFDLSIHRFHTLVGSDGPGNIPTGTHVDNALPPGLVLKSQKKSLEEAGKLNQIS